MTTTYYLHTDHLGTPQVITDDAQTVVWGADNQPFGEGSVTVNSIANNLRFPGQYFDEETGYHYNYFRTYDPTTGRYFQADPRGILLDFSDPARQVAAQMGIAIPDVGPPGYLNHTYGYVDQNPVNALDPTGESLLFGAAFGFVFDISVQLATNGGNWNCINWKNVAIATAVGAISPTLISTAQTAGRSAKAVSTLQKQLHRTRAANRRQKLCRRIHQHNSNFSGAVATQVTWQAATMAAQNNSGNSGQNCGCP